MTSKKQDANLFDIGLLKDQMLSEYNYEPRYNSKEKMTPEYLRTMVWAQVMCTIIGKLFDAENVFSWKTGLLLGVLMCFDELKPVFTDMSKEAMLSVKSTITSLKSLSMITTGVIFSKMYMKCLSFYYMLLYVFGRQLPPSPYKSPYKSWPIKYGDKFVEAFVRWLEENKDNCKFETISHSHFLDTKDTNASFVNYIIKEIRVLDEWVKCDLQFTVSKALGSTAKFVAEKQVDPKIIQNITEVWDKRICTAVSIFKESVCKHYNLTEETLINLLGNQVTDTNILFHNMILKKKYPSIEIMSSIVDVFMFSGMVNALNLPMNIVVKDGDKYRYILDPSNVYSVEEIGKYIDYSLVVPSPFDNAVFASQDVMIAVPNIIALLDQRGEDPNVFSFYYEETETFTDEKMRVFVDGVYNYECKTSRPINVYTLDLATRIAKVEETDNPQYLQWLELKKVAEKSDETMVAFIKSYPKPQEKNRKEIIETFVEKKLINDAIKLLDSLYLQEDDYRKLIQTLDQYRNKKEVFESLSLQYKLNMLLYGKPGCGKSTCITAIATYLGKDIYYVKLNNVKTNEDMQKICEYAFKGSSRGGVIVMEDIDAMCDVVHKRTKNTRVNNNGLTLDYLLNLLQGTLTMKDSIFIVTTNHIEKLDPAFYRVGRFDQKIRFKLSDHSQIRKIHKRMLGCEIPEDILRRINEYQFPPAEFIFLLKEYLYSPDTDPEIIYDNILKRSLKLRINKGFMLDDDNELLEKFKKPKQVTEDIDCTIAYDDLDEEYVVIGEDDDNIELNEPSESSVMSFSELQNELEKDVQKLLQPNKQVDIPQNVPYVDNNIVDIVNQYTQELTNNPHHKMKRTKSNKQSVPQQDEFTKIIKKIQNEKKAQQKTNPIVQALESIQPENSMPIELKGVPRSHVAMQVFEQNENSMLNNMSQVVDTITPVSQTEELTEEELLKIIAEDEASQSENSMTIELNAVTQPITPLVPTTESVNPIEVKNDKPFNTFNILSTLNGFSNSPFDNNQLRLQDYYTFQPTIYNSKPRKTNVSRVI